MSRPTAVILKEIEGEKKARPQAELRLAVVEGCGEGADGRSLSQ